MDARIGQLNGGKFYVYINGYGAEPLTGTLEQVEIALGLRPIKVIRNIAKTFVFNVTMIFQYPAWNEVEGIPYPGIEASCKSDAIKQVRKMAESDGHAIGGCGRYWFKAELA